MVARYGVSHFAIFLVELVLECIVIDMCMEKLDRFSKTA